VVDGKRLEEFDYESANSASSKEHLSRQDHLGERAQAAFVDMAAIGTASWRSARSIPDYYRIPVADREALLAEHAAMARPTPRRTTMKRTWRSMRGPISSPAPPRRRTAWAAPPPTIATTITMTMAVKAASVGRRGGGDRSDRYEVGRLPTLSVVSAVLATRSARALTARSSSSLSDAASAGRHRRMLGQQGLAIGDRECG